MKTLLLRLAAPLQSWGGANSFSRRMTGGEPTKSGVLGLIAAALGRGREEPTDDLRALRFAVRIDRQGNLLRDFHTAQAAKQKAPFISQRYYLADAVFLAGLEGADAEFMTDICDAIQSPVYPLFLGRRSCPPAGKVCLGLSDLPLESAMNSVPWLVAKRLRTRDPTVCLELICDANPGDERTEFATDKPLSYNPAHRKYTLRETVSKYIEVENRNDAATEHDPFTLLEEQLEEQYVTLAHRA
jgi:CRISPR system Cascade subunit CasD